MTPSLRDASYRTRVGADLLASFPQQTLAMPHAKGISPSPVRPERVEGERHPLVHARSRRRGRLTIFRHLGPGLITGAADDDPSGIGTYSQLGAHFGLSMLWSVPVSLPLARAGSRTSRPLTRPRRR